MMVIHRFSSLSNSPCSPLVILNVVKNPYPYCKKMYSSVVSFPQNDNLMFTPFSPVILSVAKDIGAG
jgi:hypothetical protein